MSLGKKVANFPSSDISKWYVDCIINISDANVYNRGLESWKMMPKKSRRYFLVPQHQIVIFAIFRRKSTTHVKGACHAMHACVFRTYSRTMPRALLPPFVASSARFRFAIFQRIWSTMCEESSDFFLTLDNFVSKLVYN